MVSPPAPPAAAGLALSRRLFEVRGHPLLVRLGLLDRCAVGCIGGTSQNAGLDDAASRDHAWGPHLSFFFLEEADWEAHREPLQAAVAEMPDEVEGVQWIGYDGPTPRRTSVYYALPFLRSITGLQQRPESARDWLPHLHRESFLGRRRTEQLFDASQGEVFHDPGGRFTALWRHWTAYVPPDIHRALLARGLFRVWNAGPEYNLARLHGRGDRLAYALCLARFVNEVLELAFCWHERFAPFYKWRTAHFRRLPDVPAAVRNGVDALATEPDPAAHLIIAQSVVQAIKALLIERYHLDVPADSHISAFAHAVRATVEDDAIRRHASLDW